jgi:hypothetical protein
MATSAQRIADLERQLADLTSRFAQLEEDAFVVKTMEQLIVEHVGYSAGPRAALKASPRRHLHAVDGAVR